MFFASKQIMCPVMFSLIFMFFKTAPGDSLKSDPVPIVIEKLDLGAVFTFLDFQKGVVY